MSVATELSQFGTGVSAESLGTRKSKPELNSLSSVPVRLDLNSFHLRLEPYDNSVSSGNQGGNNQLGDSEQDSSGVLS